MCVTPIRLGLLSRTNEIAASKVARCRCSKSCFRFYFKLLYYYGIQEKFNALLFELLQNSKQEKPELALSILRLTAVCLKHVGLGSSDIIKHGNTENVKLPCDKRVF